MKFTTASVFALVLAVAGSAHGANVRGAEQAEQRQLHATPGVIAVIEHCGSGAAPLAVAHSCGCGFEFESGESLTGTPCDQGCNGQGSRGLSCITQVIGPIGSSLPNPRGDLKISKTYNACVRQSCGIGGNN
ncbi:expressed unknown protein [Seminavis robusta]|uniref:Uncharacterized protein n=1 Tax=Seminavis robusta TaxID=568900 RepID=A0A9N8EK28_9STRA|nr:expressed unknown protein [Seminavis robusta]|eukprot:Sro1058_g236410.1 n/a (132) ;mRNA; f:28629-29024